DSPEKEVCTENKFEIKTVTAGQNVTLTCLRQTSALYRETFYWIRLVSGNWPEFLGATFNFKADDIKGNSGDECEKSPEAPSAQKCFYNFPETSDGGTYHCAVAACGQILFGNGVKPNIKAPSIWSQEVNIFCYFFGHKPNCFSSPYLCRQGEQWQRCTSCKQHSMQKPAVMLCASRLWKWWWTFGEHHPHTPPSPSSTTLYRPWTTSGS
ncbi:hypothetical protein ATANTOWER_021988, partial [Ataeniobius toweri]|nr:hypothetical protein [Ataeniobius toweri]